MYHMVIKKFKILHSSNSYQLLAEHKKYCNYGKKNSICAIYLLNFNPF